MYVCYVLRAVHLQSSRPRREQLPADVPRVVVHALESAARKISCGVGFGSWRAVDARAAAVGLLAPEVPHERALLRSLPDHRPRLGLFVM